MIKMRDDTNYDMYKLLNTIDSLDDLDLVTKMLKERKQQLASKTKHGLIVGEEVNINGSGKIEGGKIIKINRTRAVIDCFDKNRGFNVEYTVPFSMIRRINNG